MKPLNPSLVRACLDTLYFSGAHRFAKPYTEGRGVVDYTQAAYKNDRDNWQVLIDWIDQQNAEHQWLKDSTAETQAAADEVAGEPEMNPPATAVSVDADK